MGTPSPELKQLWIRVLRRVHPDLAIDEQDRIRCERLTKLANEAYQAGDLEALRAVLGPHGYGCISPPDHSPLSNCFPVAIAVVFLLWGCFSLYSVTTSQHPVTNPAPQQKCSHKCPRGVGHPPPFKLYGDMIHNSISRKFNPSTVVNTPAGATAVIGFTISREGSPQSVSLYASSGYPSLDPSCVNAVRQVTTFGSPEGGAKDGLNVIYDCSFHQQDGQQAPQKTSAPVENSVEPSYLYMKQMAERLHQSFSNYEYVDANVPAGNSAEMWFDVNRDGRLSNVRVGKPSGWNSLDYACVRAVQRTGDRRPLARRLQATHSPRDLCLYLYWQQRLTSIHVSQLRD